MEDLGHPAFASASVGAKGGPSGLKREGMGGFEAKLGRPTASFATGEVSTPSPEAKSIAGGG